MHRWLRERLRGAPGIQLRRAQPQMAVRTTGYVGQAARPPRQGAPTVFQQSARLSLRGLGMRAKMRVALKVRKRTVQSEHHSA
jgi:hypothetical protein